MQLRTLAARTWGERCCQCNDHLGEGDSLMVGKPQNYHCDGLLHSCGTHHLCIPCALALGFFLPDTPRKRAIYEVLANSQSI